MTLMGSGTLLYEIDRNDPISVGVIGVLLFGIIGLICVDETNTAHYVFASCAFAAILAFMCRQYFLNRGDRVLLSSLVVEIMALLSIIANIDTGIFAAEVVYIANFAFYYLYLHFVERLR
jgi:hypothetical protein